MAGPEPRYGDRRFLVLVTAHVLLIAESTFLISLLLMIVGTGFLKTNLLGQIGRLYAPGDDRRSRAFGLWLISLNTGSMITPVDLWHPRRAARLAVRLRPPWRWAWGWGPSATSRVCVTCRKMWSRSGTGRGEARAAPAVKSGDGRVIGVIVLLVVLDAIWTGIYNQAFNIFPIWAEEPCGAPHPRFPHARHPGSTPWMA